MHMPMYCIWLKAQEALVQTGGEVTKEGSGRVCVTESPHIAAGAEGIPPPLPACLSLPSSSHHLGPVRPKEVLGIES